MNVCYYLELSKAINLFIENVLFYQEKSFVFYNIRTTYWTFVSKNWIPE